MAYYDFCYTVSFYDCTAARYKQVNMAVCKDLDHALEVIYDTLKNMAADDTFTAQKTGEVMTAEDITDLLEQAFKARCEVYMPTAYADSEVFTAEDVPAFMVSIECTPYGKFYPFAE